MALTRIRVGMAIAADRRWTACRMKRPAAKASGGIAMASSGATAISRATAAAGLAPQGGAARAKERAPRASDSAADGERDGKARARAPAAPAGSTPPRRPRPLQATESERGHDEQAGRGKDGMPSSTRSALARRGRVAPTSLPAAAIPAWRTSSGAASATTAPMTPIWSNASTAARAKSTSKRSAS